MFGSRPKKPKGSAAATKRDEAAAKANRFRKEVKTPQLIDPAADLPEAKERNAREVREEQEATRLEKAEAEKAEAAALKKLAEAEAADAAKKQAEEAAHRQSAVFNTPLNSAPPPPEFTAQTREVGNENPIMERDGGDTAMPDMIVLPPLSGSTQGGQRADPPVPPTENEVATGLALEVGTPTRRRLAKAASAPRPLETGAASSSIPDTEATSAAPTGWVRGSGTGPLNRALLDVQAKIRAEGEAIRNCNKAHRASREAVRELAQRTADLSESRKANATLQQQLGEANTMLRAKEEECSKLAGERDRLVTQLAEQKELLKKA
nr:uncharacterized protein LOC123495894 [Aegilops tauschii subsp. strangulata]